MATKEETEAIVDGFVVCGPWLTAPLWKRLWWTAIWWPACVLYGLRCWWSAEDYHCPRRDAFRLGAALKTPRLLWYELSEQITGDEDYPVSDKLTGWYPLW